VENLGHCAQLKNLSVLYFPFPETTPTTDKLLNFANLFLDFYMKYTSGQIVPQSGIYGVYTSSGVKTNEATCVKGEPFPPTPAPNMYYKMVRATR